MLNGTPVQQLDQLVFHDSPRIYPGKENRDSIRKPNFGSFRLIYDVHIAVDRILPFFLLRMCERS